MSFLKNIQSFAVASLATLSLIASVPAASAQATSSNAKPPNIIVIMGDDVGWFNVGAYHQGMMSGKTPNLDKLAAEGMRFTGYYAEASCTAGRANFITGEVADPHRIDDCRPGRSRCGYA